MDKPITEEFFKKIWANLHCTSLNSDSYDNSVKQLKNKGYVEESSLDKARELWQHRKGQMNVNVNVSRDEIQMIINFYENAIKKLSVKST